MSIIELRIERQANGKLALGLSKEVNPAAHPQEAYIAHTFCRIIEAYMADYLKHVGQGTMIAGDASATPTILAALQREGINPDIAKP